MRFYSKFIILILTATFFACAGEEKSDTPLDTLRAYGNAIKQKDTTTMKLLLSDASIKMAEEEAKSRGVTLDEIVQRETLFNPTQKSVDFRNQKIEGDKATIEMKDSYNAWNTVPFVRENGIWKIDKQSAADIMMRDFEKQQKENEDKINQGRQP